MNSESEPQTPPKFIVRIVASIIGVLALVSIVASVYNFSSLGAVYALSIIVFAGVILFFSILALKTGNPEWVLLGLLHGW